MTEFQKKLRNEWIKALRSGKYSQGRDALCRDGKHCVLGVLRDVYDKMFGGPAGDTPILLSTSEVRGMGLSSVAGDFHPTQKERLEFASLYEGIDHPEFTLSYLNDNGVGFGRLASLIEQHHEIFYQGN